MRMIVHGALLLAIGACTTRAASSDSAHKSSTVDTARANESAGDLSGAPVDTTRARAESASAAQGTPQTRGDGRRSNPPLHRVPPPRDTSPSIPPRRKL